MRIASGFFIASIVALGGCVAPYVQPIAGPTSTIKFENAYANKAYTYVYEGAELCTARKGSGQVEPNSNLTITVPAQKEFVFTHTVVPGSEVLETLAFLYPFSPFKNLSEAQGSACLTTIEFVPKDGANYVFSIGGTERPLCEFSFAEEPSKGQEKQPLSYSKREFTRALGESGPWCQPQ